MKIFGNRIGLFTKNFSLKMQGNQVLFLKKYQAFSFSTKNEKNVDNNKSTKNTSNREDDLEETNSLLNITSEKILEMKKEIEEKIVDGELALNFIPSPNYFGEIPIFISPNESFAKRLNNELSGLSLLSSITVLNYLGLVYPPSFFYYFAFLTFSSAFKIITGSGQNNQIVLMTLVDEKNVRIVYLSGVEEIVSIKNIAYSPDDRFNSLLVEKDDNRGGQKNRMSNFSGMEDGRVGNKRMAVMSMIINNKRKNLILRNNILGNRGNYSNSLAFADMTLLMGIINRKTKKIRFNVNVDNQDAPK